MWTVSTNRCRSLPHPPSFIVPTCRFSFRSSSLVLRKWKILLCQDSTCLVLLSRHFVPTSCSPGYVVSQGLDYKIINETMSVSEHGHVLRRTSLRLRSIVLRSSIRLSILLYPHFLFLLLLLSRWPRKIQQKRIVAAPVRGDDALII